MKHPFNGELFCNIKNIYSAEDQVGIKAYRRIAGKELVLITYLLICTNVKVVIANRPEMLVSDRICMYSEDALFASNILNRKQIASVRLTSV